MLKDIGLVTCVFQSNHATGGVLSVIRPNEMLALACKAGRF